MTLRLDVTGRALIGPAGRTHVTAIQIRLLRELLAKPGHAFRHEELIEAIWHGHAPAEADTALRVHIRYLRLVLAEVSPHAMITASHGPSVYTLTDGDE